MDDHARPNGPAPGHDGDLSHSEQVTHTLNAVEVTVVALLGCTDAQPTYVRVSADTVAVELRWESVMPTARADLGGGHPAPAVGAPAAGPGAQPAAAGQPDDGPAFITAPLVGVFYRASAPGVKPFVEVGDVVSPGQQVAIVEAMKMMIPVDADQPGRIAQILCQNAEAVEYGQALFGLEAPGAAPNGNG